MTSNQTRYHETSRTKIDFTMMYASHDAFRRDLRRMAAAARDGRAGSQAVRAGWETFKQQLHVHHTAEDAALWPIVRVKVAQHPDALDLLDEMEDEHAQIDPLLASVDSAVDAGDAARLSHAVAKLAEALDAHLAHEEEKVLPLIDARLTQRDWAGFGKYLRQRQGLKGAATFFPWLLDGAPAETRSRVLGVLPPPVRLLYRGFWRRSYYRIPRWNG